MADEYTRFPLSWPAGWRRTAPGQRRRAHFGTKRAGEWKKELSIGAAITRLVPELKRLGGRDEILSTNVRVRLDGLPYSDGPNVIADPGAALYFTLKGKPRVLACDKWDRVADNIGAIAAHIEAIRAVDRYGVGTIEQAFAGYTALPPSVADWWIVLGVGRDATADQIDEAYRELARRSHPDAGGSHDQMARINAARDAARAQVG